jgi:hypothetical protein
MINKIKNIINFFNSDIWYNKYQNIVGIICLIIFIVINLYCLIILY